MRHGGIWRRIGVFLAAYLLVAQAAIAGVTPHHAAPDMGPQSDWTLCVTDASGSPAAPGQAGDLSCCGLGCLVGAHLLVNPHTVGGALNAPVIAAAGTIGEAQGVRPPAPAVRERSPRGPPAQA